MARNKFDYTHGDTGTEPPNSLNFESGDKPNSEYFDWKWYNTVRKINQLWDEFDRIDDNDDGVVDEADYANDADASTYKGEDIDSDGDGQVDSADEADNTTTVKGNDIDSDGDGQVDSADEADIGLSMETRDDYPSDPEDGRMVFRTDLA